MISAKENNIIYSVYHHSTAHYSTTQHTTPHYTPHYSTPQHNTPQHTTAQHSTAVVTSLKDKTVLLLYVEYVYLFIIKNAIDASS